MATPTEWLNEFQVNTGTAANGFQSEPQIIGLANGNIVVAWVESAAGSIGTSPGTDIVAKIYDAEGNVVRDSFQLNVFANADDERDFEIAATHDGFVLTAIDDDISSPNQTSVVFERFDFDGDRLFGAGTSFNIALENVAADFLRNPQIAVNKISTNDDIFIAYDDDVGADTDVNARVIDQAGALGAEFGAAQNSADFDRLGDTAVLDNGNFVTVYEEADGGTTSLEFTIRTPAGGIIPGPGANGSFAIDNGPASDPQVISLADGAGFVVTWVENNDIYMRGFDNAGGATFATTLVASGANLQNEPTITANPLGGFAVFWDDDTSGDLFGRAFTSAGAADGAVFQVTTASPTQIDSGTTGDGRYLITWQDELGEIFASIWDPRPATINPNEYGVVTENFVRSDVITTLTTDTTVLAGSINDTVLGQDGDDTIFSSSVGEFFGGGGDDLIVAGAFTGGSQFELLDGGTGNDTVDASSFTGDYTINLVTGDTDYPGAPVGGNESFVNFENIITGVGDDSITGTAGANLINTSGGDDTINSGLGNDTVNAGAGNDVVTNTNNGGSDLISGGLGDDTLTSSGESTIFGEGGNDVIFAGLGTAELLDGGIGNDTLNTTLFNGNYVVNLQNGVTNFNPESFINFENIILGNGNDEALGTLVANRMEGGGGNDRLRGFGGNDSIFGGTGDDTVIGNEGDDSLEGGDGIDRAFGGFGNDTIGGGIGDDSLEGFDGNDMIDGGADNDFIRGGTGNDTLTGGLGDDTIRANDDDDVASGGSGADTVDGGNGNDNLFGGIGNDLVVGGSGVDTLRGESGNDTLRGDGGNDFLDGGADNDRLFGSSGEDTLRGGSGNDLLEGNTQADQLFGEDGNDTLRGEDGFDFLSGGNDNDTLVGGNGNDTLRGDSGADVLRGNANNDTFLFLSTSDSTTALTDLIDGIDGVGVGGGDVIDVSAIDANLTIALDQAFFFFGELTTAQGLAQGAGALWVENSGGQTVVFGNVDNDATIELAILINDGAGIVAADYTSNEFIL